MDFSREKNAEGVTSPTQLSISTIGFVFWVCALGVGVTVASLPGYNAVTAGSCG